MAQRHGAHERDARGGSTGGGHGAHRRPGDGEFGARETGDDDFGDWFDSWDLEPEDAEPARPRRRRRDEKRTRKSAKLHGASWGPKTSSKHAQAGDGKLAAFAQEYGWRAYAIPVLAVITVFVLINMFQNPEDLAVGSTASSAEEEESAASSPAQREEDPDGGVKPLEPAKIAEGEFDPHDLPPGGPYTTTGAGTFYEVGAPGMTAGEGTELVVRFAVEVEHGIDTSGYGGDEAFAHMVDATLSDPRGWINDPRFRFEHVSVNDNPSLKIRLTSLDTTAELCGVQIGTETSCRTRITGEDTVLLNESRWVRGAVPFQGDLGSYRQYLINHEVGHAVGFAEHVPCPEPNALAPVMMQQTLSLNNAQLRELSPEDNYPDNPDTCRPNPWPYPRPAAL
ncbi:DUF3152 domain-containing protein [uncultured Corynebacterium sp.]|uniref:DUF3152 domain-containing protein n=1 Tax=uncultured Corynebacterium sp. TaxID=159447 RepID=UPI0025F59767|nr:DUF3152 domain-containing protein [uncultured Corynebacterium sp.]